jgi:hypothetical protein
MNTETQTPKASMSEVVMRKHELVNILKENKEKHDILFDTAREEYWETAKQITSEKQKKLGLSVKEFQEEIDFQINKLNKKIENKETLPYQLAVKTIAWDFGLNLVYPENHTKDYEKAIRMMEASIYEEVALSAEEFDSYVLNNWEWKQKFLVSNSYYLNNRKNRLGNFNLLSGSTITGTCLSKASADALTDLGSDAF